MKRDDGERTVGGEKVGRIAQQIVEHIQFPVDGDAQRLKCFRGGMNAAAVHHAQRVADELFEFSSGIDWIRCALLNDGARDAPRFVFVAILKEDVGDFVFTGFAQNVGGGARLRAVHAHVERFVGSETETARWIVELHRRDAYVGQNRIGRRRVKFLENIGKAAEIRMDEMQRDGVFFGERRESCSRQFQSGGVGVDADQDSGGSDALDQRGAMSSGAKRGIDRTMTRLRIQRRERLL